MSLLNLVSGGKHQFANHDIYHSYGTNHSRGVSIVVDKSCQTNWQYALEKVDVNGWYVELKIIGEYEVCLAAIYAPVSYTEREIFLTDLNQEHRQHDNHIICGDFNCVIDPKKDKISSSLRQPRTASINTMQKFIADFNLVDVYRKTNPDIPGFTWMQQHSGVAERIAMFLVSTDISHDICDISGTPAAFSDHSSIMMSMQGLKSKSKATKGQAYWKFNTSFLQEECFRIQIIALWEHWRQQKYRFESIMEWWDSGKSQIRELCIKYGIIRRKRQTQRRRKIEMSLQKADLRVQNGHLSTIRAMEKYKSLLTKLDREEICGRHVRCRTEWLEHGETSRKFSASTEKRQAGKHQFCQLKTDIGMAKT